MQELTLAHLAISAPPGPTIDAAAAAGFGAVGLRICGRRPRDPFETPVVGHDTMIRSLRQRAADQGVRLSNVSGYQFYPDVTWDDVAPVIDAAHGLGVPIVVVNGFDPDLARFTALFARYCQAAAAAGMRVALEFLPYSSVRNLGEALRVLDASGADNAGLLLDVLHLDRSGGRPADIAAIDPARIVFAQLCDASREPAGRSNDELLHEARFARLPAGAGGLPVHEFLDALPQGLEIEYEVARLDLADASPPDKALAASADARRFMQRHAERRRTPDGYGAR